MGKKNTIIFDLDGTLLNTLADLTASLNYTMALHGFPCHTQEQVRQMVGNGIYVLMEQAVPDGSGNPRYRDCIREFQEHYKMHEEDFRDVISTRHILVELKEQAQGLLKRLEEGEAFGGLAEA